MSNSDKIIIGIILAVILGFYVYYKKLKNETAVQHDKAAPALVNEDHILKFGSSGDPVRQLQEALNERIMFDKIHGNETVSDTLFVNGRYGTLTLKAVEFYTGDESINIADINSITSKKDVYQ